MHLKITHSMKKNTAMKNTLTPEQSTIKQRRDIFE